MPDIFLFPIGAAVVLGAYQLLQARPRKEPSPSIHYPGEEQKASINIIRLTTTNNDRSPIGSLFSDLSSLAKEDS